MSRHSTLAQAIVDHLKDNWAGKPADAEIVRSHKYEQLITQMKADATSIVAVVVPRIDSDEETRGADEDRIQVLVCLVAALDDTALATVDAWDDYTESCRDELRNRTLQEIDISGTDAERQGSASLAVTADEDFLDEQKVFFAVIELIYTLSVDLAA